MRRGNPLWLPFAVKYRFIRIRDAKHRVSTIRVFRRFALPRVSMARVFVSTEP